MYGMYGYPQPTYYDYIRQSMGQAPQPQSNVLPAQQVLKAKGRASIDTLQMAPNSSIFIMDETAPLIWLCVSDGLGKVTATAYDIAVHQDTPPFDIAAFADSVEGRLKALESKITDTEVKRDDKPDVAGSRSGDKPNSWSAGKS